MSKFSFSSVGSQAKHAAMASSTGTVRHVTIAPEAQVMALEFVFLPSSGENIGSGPWPPHHHRKPKQWQNPNRQGTPLAFWRKVKDGLRYLTGSNYRGSYTAPGPNGRPNNIVPERLPGRGIDVPGSGRDGIAQLAPGRPHLDVPPLPPSTPPGYLDSLPTLPSVSPPVAVQLKPTRFKGLTLTPDEPISYKQEIHFIGDTDSFINRAQAQRVMRELLKLMQDHPNVYVTILGNAAVDFATPAFKAPYGNNRAVLRKFPMYGYYDGKACYGPKFRTIGDLMLARARAIANLLISQGIAPYRIHCNIGNYGYGKAGVPGSADRKRRATIVISEKP
jgi:outer membrane protein OmpA-like peptidoglycan-associated protein